jgi:3-phenylpropionate/trans-cinnamate dioxygenase ferredoxin reductase subunit
MTDTITVIGASLAGLHAARTLRQKGFEGRLVVVDAEPHKPYDRPPLSKQVLSGEQDAEHIALQAPDELDIDWRLGTRAVALDAKARSVDVVTLAGDAGTVAYDQLVIATGAAARTLPGTDGIEGVHVLRSLDDSLAVRAQLDAGARKVVVIGAGFIGAEVAATCRERGCDVTMVEALPVPLERAIGAEMGMVCARLHEQHGVDVRLGTAVDRIESDVDAHGHHRVRSVELSDGTSVPADIVVVGIGVQVNTGWLEGSGLTLDDGIVVDDTLLAAPGIVAAGDLARYPSARYGQQVRVEHWDHAIVSGEAAAKRLLAEQIGEEPATFDPVPWFWSDQYDRKIHLAGRAAGHDQVKVVHGDVNEFVFVAVYGRGDQFLGVLGMNRPRHVVRLRALLDRGADLAEAIALAESL